MSYIFYYAILQLTLQSDDVWATDPETCVKSNTYGLTTCHRPSFGTYEYMRPPTQRANEIKENRIKNVLSGRVVWCIFEWKQVTWCSHQFKPMVWHKVIRMNEWTITSWERERERGQWWWIWSRLWWSERSRAIYWYDEAFEAACEKCFYIDLEFPTQQKHFKLCI